MMKMIRVHFLVATLAAAISFVFMAAARNSTPPKTVLGSSVFDWNDLKPQPTKVGARREVFDAPTATLGNLECHVTTINAGEAPHAPHRHPDEELLIIKEGTVEVTINGVTKSAGPGSLVFFASNDLHGLRNTGTIPATYFVLRINPHDLHGLRNTGTIPATYFVLRINPHDLKRPAATP